MFLDVLIATHASSPARPWLAATLFMVVLGLLCGIRQQLARTTLQPPAHWAIFAWIVLGFYQWSLHHHLGTAPGAREIPPWAPAAHWSVAVLSLCPIMAILGARQPQSRGWQWIVASLWAILALPAVTAAWIRGGGALEVHALQGWFLWILIAVGVINYLPTKFAPAAALIGLGQILLLQHHLPLLHNALRPLPNTSWQALVTVNILSLLAAAWTTLALSADRSTLCQPGPATREEADDSPQTTWKRFRNRFGLVWGLRVAERFNAAGALLGWPTRLRWSGFDGPSPTSDPAMERSFYSSLRKFQSGNQDVSRPLDV